MYDTSFYFLTSHVSYVTPFIVKVIPKIISGINLSLILVPGFPILPRWVSR